MITQIYEIQSEAEAELVLSLGADHIGSVVVSKTDLSDKEIRSAIDLTQKSGKKSSLIPLFNDIMAIRRCIEYYRPDVVHLCDTIAMEPLRADAVDPLIDTQAEIRNDFPEIKIMRSIPIFEPGKGQDDNVLDLARQIEPYSDFFLIDTILHGAENKTCSKDQPVAGFIGITGRICDWEIASKLVMQAVIPVILAGGLGPSNVTTAIKKVQPFGVDSCTATNAIDTNGKSIRFKKDPEKVRQFIAAARAANALISSP
jgi:phosphoribosylanthranilate isomerase